MFLHCRKIIRSKTKKGGIVNIELSERFIDFKSNSITLATIYDIVPCTFCSKLVWKTYKDMLRHMVEEHA